MSAQRLSRFALVGGTTLLLGALCVRGLPRHAAPSGAPPAKSPPALLAPRLLSPAYAPQPPVGFSVTQGMGETALALSRRLRLLGTMLGASPLAMIQDTQARTTRAYTLHESVTSARLEEIHRGSARLVTSQGDSAVLFLESAGVESPLEVSDRPPLLEARHARSGLTIQLRPAFGETDGVFQGLLIETLESPGLTRSLDLRPGDLLTAVNDQPLLTPAQSLQVLKKAWRQPKPTVTLERNGHTLTLGSRLDI